LRPKLLTARQRPSFADNGLLSRRENNRASVDDEEDEMRAIVITAPGVDNNLRVTEAPEPTPGPGEVLIDVAYCGCNFADTMIAKGTYPHPKGYPIIGGSKSPGGSPSSGWAFRA
jgi:hypothetical protein